MSSDKRKILFLTFTPLIDKGGHSKNFLNLLKHLGNEIKEHNHYAKIISFNNTSDIIKYNLTKIKESSYLDIYQIIFLKRIFPSGKTIFQITEYLINIFRAFKNVIQYKPDIIYSYGEKPVYLVFTFKRFLKFRLIYDMRGDILDEHKARGASNGYLSLLRSVHFKAVNKADIAFSVSDSYNLNTKLKFIPKYNYYDGNVFRYDEDMMQRKKKALNLEGNFIFVYTGNTHYYQYLEGTIKFFSQFIQKHNDSFLIIITEHDTSRFTELLMEYNIPDDNYMITSLHQNEISDLQQIADMGFLMREDLPLNHHSFPTKFAEYLASGVPVLMTPYINTIAPIVTKNNLGEVIEIKNDHSEEIDNIYKSYKNNLKMKKQCSEFAMEELMWQNKAKDIFNILENI